MSNLKNLPLIIFLVSFIVGSRAEAKFLNIQYSVLESAPIIGVGLGNFSLSYMTVSESSKTGSLEIEGTRTDIRLDYWPSGAFMDSWYIGAASSTITVDINYSSDTLNTTTFEVEEIDYEGSGTATGTVFFVGYHWQWSYLNLALGAYAGSYSSGTFEVESDTGETENQTAPITASGGEVKIGIAF
ncbi:hypothetical protein N9N67_01015 [Bacteriovoracaceae bacterium]|nr:hypothetical protein [Bacteriovoracaceae bacterium]